MLKKTDEVHTTDQKEDSPAHSGESAIQSSETLSEKVSRLFAEMEETRMDKMLRSLDRILATPRS